MGMIIGALKGFSRGVAFSFASVKSGAGSGDVCLGEAHIEGRDDASPPTAFDDLQ